ncbi:histidine phosphatase family protein [Spirochaeta africana]|uniref:Fructose-2,6-bisphosphatase n=1 Tax=Spirochaeta africana (strain ATCC 700263 / DSM 8902 / Z-7692) TaxID=889378 RepID=H9UI92_SPIAZ|nr:histidine phosphatase family protein [Spirochaeta africana]AFG37235.1 fructose-2,6-bisphosphatase [Spirochaeta africana DSM 8902]
MHIYCIRHGESTNNCLEGDAEYHLKRSHDPALTPRGTAQAAAAADFLQDHLSERYDNPPVLYSSYMTRALQTAAALSAKLTVPIQAWRDIHERGGCVAYSEKYERYEPHPGLGATDLHATFPMLQSDDHIHISGWNTMRTPESQRQCYMRAKRVLRELIARHNGDTRPVILVSHRIFIGALAAAVVDGSHSQLHRFGSHNAGITHLTAVNGEFFIEYQNRYEFLPRHLRTDIPYMIRM